MKNDKQKTKYHLTGIWRISLNKTQGKNKYKYIKTERKME